MPRSAVRGPGSNQHADKPPLAPTDPTLGANTSTCVTTDPFAEGPDPDAFGPGPYVGSVGLTDPDRFCEAFLPSEKGPTWDTAAAYMDANDTARDGVYTYSDLMELAGELQRDGFTEPVLVQGCFVVDGHHRVAAARMLGLPIPYERVDGHDDLLHRDLDGWDDQFGPQTPDAVLEQWPDPSTWAAQVDAAHEAQEALHWRDDLDEPYFITDASGNGVDLRPGVIDDQARHVFLNGHCHSLALAAWQRAPEGWSMVALHDTHATDDHGAPLVRHVMLRSPTGDLIDIDNCVPEDRLRAVWDAGTVRDAQPISSNQVADMGFSDYFAEGLETGIASLFVPTMLSRAGYDPATWKRR